MELVTECIHKQASLAEAFLNALELKECVQKEAGEESEGFVHIALSIVRKVKLATCIDIVIPIVNSKFFYVN